jgi:hypothetical protein
MIENVSSTKKKRVHVIKRANNWALRCGKKCTEIEKERLRTGDSQEGRFSSKMGRIRSNKPLKTQGRAYSDFDKNVFINCPFDKNYYIPMLRPDLIPGFQPKASIQGKFVFKR